MDDPNVFDRNPFLEKLRQLAKEEEQKARVAYNNAIEARDHAVQVLEAESARLKGAREAKELLGE